jgi:hypothetical protein
MTGSIPPTFLLSLELGGPRILCLCVLLRTGWSLGTTIMGLGMPKFVVILRSRKLLSTLSRLLGKSVVSRNEDPPPVRTLRVGTVCDEMYESAKKMQGGLPLYSEPSYNNVIGIIYVRNKSVQAPACAFPSLCVSRAHHVMASPIRSSGSRPKFLLGWWLRSWTQQGYS